MPPTATLGSANARLSAAFDASTVRAGTGAVSMIQRADPSSDTEATVVDMMPTQNARPHGTNCPRSGTSSDCSWSSGSAPVFDIARSAAAPTTTST